MDSKVIEAKANKVIQEAIKTYLDEIQTRDRLPHNKRKVKFRSQMEMLWFQTLTLKTKSLGNLCFQI
jgi:hypothetical protein